MAHSSTQAPPGVAGGAGSPHAARQNRLGDCVVGAAGLSERISSGGNEVASWEGVGDETLCAREQELLRWQADLEQRERDFVRTGGLGPAPAAAPPLPRASLISVDDAELEVVSPSSTPAYLSEGATSAISIPSSIRCGSRSR